MRSYLKRASELLALTLLLGCGAAPPPAQLPEVDGLASAVDATVGIVDDLGRPHCAGVWIGTVVATAAHCVADKPDVETWGAMYKDWGGRTFERSFPFRTVHRDDIQDLALLSPNTILPGALHASAGLASTAPIRGQAVVVIGHPLGLPYTLTEGIVSYARRTDGVFPGMVWLQISAPVSPGNSGGPVFDHYGQVIGIVSFRLSNHLGGAEPHLAGAIHWESISAAMRQ